MTKRITQEKAENIARCLFEAKWNYTQGLLKAGYSESYARTGESNKTYLNPLVKAEIDKIKAKAAEKWDLTVDAQIKETKKLRDSADASNHHTAALTANDQLNRHIGFYNADTSAGLSIVDIMAIVGITAPDSP